jgi:hypothetical protein
MPRKEKVYVRPMEDAMSGGSLPLDVMKSAQRYTRGYGLCCLCKNHIDMIDSDDDDEMRGGGYLSKAAEKVENVTRKGASKVKKVGKATGKYVTNVNGLASDVVNYGLPAAGSATLGALGSATGNPLIGVAASALGAKLGTVLADKIADETVIQSRTGEGMKPKRKGRFEKGSQESKDYMASLRAKKGKK